MGGWVGIEIVTLVTGKVLEHLIPETSVLSTIFLNQYLNKDKKNGEIRAKFSYAQILLQALHSGIPLGSERHTNIG